MYFQGYGMWAEDEIRDWLMEAAANTGCAVEMLPDAEEERIIAKLRDMYTNGEQDPGQWWQDLKLPYEYFDSTKTELSEILPSLDGYVHLIPEAPRRAFIYRIKAADLQAVIWDCYGFLYAVASEDASWLVIENDHNQYYRCFASDAMFLKNLPHGTFD